MIQEEVHDSLQPQMPRRSTGQRFPYGDPRNNSSSRSKRFHHRILAVALLLPTISFPLSAEVDGAAAADGNSQPPAGLYFRTDKDDIAMEGPLLKSDVDISVNGIVARVHLRQRFVNPSNQCLEGIYVFPLPEKSAVDRLTMRIGERRVKGKIMAKDEARKPA